METFKRVEHKYLITKEKEAILIQNLKEHIVSDTYPSYSLHNIYYDSDDFRMIRHSIEGPSYKEKLRIRSYGNPAEENTYFEIKKKYEGIVYKRRVPYKDNLVKQSDLQVQKEIDYIKKFYEATPKLFLSYDRKAYIGIKEKDVRITFDTNIKYRFENLDLYNNASLDENLLDEKDVLMEIKVMDRYPLWLANVLTHEKIHRTSFSKYGTIYTRYIKENRK